MPDVFGVAASGIGIAGVAAQAIDGIRKLQAFCNDIRDAPEEVKYLTTELEILLGTIASIETQIQRNPTMCGNMDPTPALRFVDQSVRSLIVVIEDLNAKIAQKRTLGSMKMAWKKKILESRLMKIERSKTSLGLAVSAYSTELYLQNTMKTNTTIDQLSMNVTTLIASCQAQLTPSFGPQFSDSRQTRRKDRLVVDEGNDKDWAGIRKKHKPPKQISVICFTLTVPLWLAQRSLQIDVCRTAQNWTLSLRPYRTISYYADIWGTIRQGDFDRIRDLIESGQATVFDRLDNGWTLLHEVGSSASSYDRQTFSQITRFLIDRGADVNEPTHAGRLPIHRFCCMNFSDPLELSTDLRSDDVFRILGNEIDLDEDSFWKVFQGTYAITCSTRVEEELKRRFQLDILDFPTITMADRSRDIRHFPCSFSPQKVASYLGIESFEIAFPTSNVNTKRELLCVALNKWGYSSGEGNPASEEWGQTVQSLLALGASFDLLGRVEEKEDHPDGTKGRTVGYEAVAEVIRHFAVDYVWAKFGNSAYQYDARDVADGFEYFISKTECLGIRLGASSSCRRFEICIDDGFVYSSETLDAEDCWDCWWKPHEFSLYYDNNLSTWVMWDSMYETFCGEFWDLLEHPERTMPGTWVD